MRQPFNRLRSALTLPRVAAGRLLRKEVIQPLVPQRLPCYDFIPITTHTFDGAIRTGAGFRDWLRLAASLPIVPAIVARVRPWT